MNRQQGPAVGPAYRGMRERRAGSWLEGHTQGARKRRGAPLPPSGDKISEEYNCTPAQTPPTSMARAIGGGKGTGWRGPEVCRYACTERCGARLVSERRTWAQAVGSVRVSVKRLLHPAGFHNLQNNCTCTEKQRGRHSRLPFPPASPCRVPRVKGEGAVVPELEEGKTSRQEN